MKEDDLLNLRKFVAPEFVFGVNARKMLIQYVYNLGITNVLLVTDKGLLENGWVDEIEADLTENNVRYTMFSDVTPNPKDYEVMHGVEVYKRNGCNGIVAIGGGSPMDCAKGIGIVVKNNGHILDYEGVDEIPVPCPPLIFLPSTSGTSADVSQFAIIIDSRRKNKIAIVSKAVVPDISLIDPVVTTTMDYELTAHTGLDALTHALEALVSNAGSSVTEIHALKAIELIFSSLLKTLEHPDDINLRTDMSWASLHAGLAFSNASLGAVHAMAHALGGVYDLPHGQCNSILLPHVVRFNISQAGEQYRKILPFIGIDTKADLQTQNELVLDSISKIVKNAGVTDTLASLGVKETDLSLLAEFAVEDACMVTNPVFATKQDIEKVFLNAI